MLVNLGDALRKVVHDMIHRVIERDFHQRPVGENTRHFTTEGLVNYIVVIGIEEASLLEITAEYANLIFG
jgi:hypothetical protein